MSDFRVSLEVVENVQPLFDKDGIEAERIEKVSLVGIGYQFFSEKNAFKVGDTVLYIPLDALLPPNLIEKLNLDGKLAGTNKNRVRTYKLNKFGAWSEGILAKPLQLLTQEQFDQQLNDYAEILGIVKEVDEVELEEVKAKPRKQPKVNFSVKKYLPRFLRNLIENYEAKVNKLSIRTSPAYSYKYDIENWQKYQHIIDRMKDTPLYVTEKLEGQHISVHLLHGYNHKIKWLKYLPSLYKRLATEEDYLILMSRTQVVRQDKPSNWATIFNQYNWLDVMLKIRELLGANIEDEIAIRGEIVGNGIQRNIYGIDGLKAFFFDIEVNKKRISGEEFLRIMREVNLPIVPVLIENKVVENIYGLFEPSSSQINPEVLREGQVIKPFEKSMIPMIKERNSEYLRQWDEGGIPLVKKWKK